MALKQNIIYIYFKGKHQVTSKSQYQYNRGQYLYFADLNLPQAFEVHFSNKNRGESKTQICSNKLVEIPDEYFWSGALEIYAWVYLHSGTDDGETIYEVKIPLIKRAKPTDEEPLPVQQSAIDKAIAELNNAVDITNENADKTNADKTQVSTIKEEVVTLKEEIDSTANAVNQDAQSARESADASEQSAQNSAESERKALDYSDEAKGYAQSALESKDTANQKAQVATDASAEAKGYRDEAETFKNEVEQAKQNIVDYRNETKGYRDEVLTAKDDAQTIKGDVQSLKTQIDKTATDVETNASDAKSSADLSYRSAISADKASLSASQFADEASGFADSASQSANQAEEFKNQSATNVTHYPKVVDGYWYVWDASNAEYVNTNVDARGIKGDKGDTGATGDTGSAGADAKINGVNTLTIEAGTNISLDQEGNTLTINSTGGGGGGTSDYTQLTNKPKINNVELNGNKTSSDLGLQPAGNYALESDIPTKTSDLNNDSRFIDKNVNNLTNYYKTSETYNKTEIDNKISSVYKYKGTVATYANLPSSDLTVGDVYNVESTGDNYAWTGTVWDKLGGDIDLSGYQPKIDSTHKLSSDLVDDTGNTNKFVTSTDKTNWNAKYDKPSGGIPKTDLASDVQTSLGKADTALQSETYTGTITGITMNGASKGTSGVVDLGTVITSHQDISGKANKISVVQTSTSTIEINPNTFYKFGEVASLNITLASITDNTIYNEYMFEFVSGTTATTLTLPSSIKWLETPTIDANKIYQCSIVDNVGLLVGVTNV